MAKYDFMYSVRYTLLHYPKYCGTYMPRYGNV